MESNYDEVISRMLRQIGRHSEQLEAQSARLEAQIRKSDALWEEQRRENARHIAQLDAIEERSAAHFEEFQERARQYQEHSDRQHEQLSRELEQRSREHRELHNRDLELILQTATILDRIIKRNDLKL